ncbi:hypothetical protein [Oceanirhabdus seepicola]|uniref:Uncharacterized protein n=1 Tax=Oceanirhabdus seepicola TaxID=2828781 RepID=A0A9J6NWK3_9CLOT|nr:hypothetical protein [Oceanirhabdus seepicola]MCM1988887.1 hypothetical protein [Oceanirhabdus seepicola]
MGYNPASILTAPLAIAFLILTGYILSYTSYYMKRAGFKFKFLKNAVKPDIEHKKAILLVFVVFVALVFLLAFRKHNKILNGELNVQIGRISSTRIITKKSTKGSDHTIFTVNTLHGKRLNFDEYGYYNLTPYVNSKELIYIIYNEYGVLKFDIYNEEFDESKYDDKIMKLHNEYISSVNKDVFDYKNLADTDFSWIIPFAISIDIILLIFNFFLKMSSRNLR